MTKIPVSAITWLLITAALAILLPIIILLIWRVKTKSKIVPALCGAGIFILFALILESVPKMILFTGKNSLSVYILNHAWAYTFFGCLLAGVFEETGRFLAFRFLLKKYPDKKTAVSYGIGHGGIEAMILVGINMIAFAAMAIMINTGIFDTVFSAAPAEQAEALTATMTSIPNFGFASCLMSISERLMAITLHISLSVVVFMSVGAKGKGFLFPLAILLHMLFDVPAALYQFGVLNIYICELCIVLFTAAVAVFAARLYKTTAPE